MPMITQYSTIILLCCFRFCINLISNVLFPSFLFSFLCHFFFSTGHFFYRKYFKISPSLHFAVGPLLMSWTMIPLLLLLCFRFNKQKRESDHTLKGDLATNRSPSARNSPDPIIVESIRQSQVGVDSPIETTPRQSGNTMRTTEDQVDEKTSSKGKKESDTDKEQKNDTKLRTPQKRGDGDFSSMKSSNSYMNRKNAMMKQKSPKAKSIKSNKSSNGNTATTPKLLVSGKEDDKIATAWPVRPCWSDAVAESQIQDDLSDFGLTKTETLKKRGDTNKSVFVDEKKKSKNDKKGIKKEDKKEDNKKSSVFFDEKKEKVEEKKDEGKKSTLILDRKEKEGKEDEKKEEKVEDKKMEEKKEEKIDETKVDSPVKSPEVKKEDNEVKKDEKVEIKEERKD